MKKTHNNGKDATEKALDVFSDMLIEKIESLTKDDKWEQPWFTEGSAMRLPININGRRYNGMNSIMLMLAQEKAKYELPIWGTFNSWTSHNWKQIDGKPQMYHEKDEEGNELPVVHINKGEKSMPVFITTFTVVNKKTHERIPYDEYKELDYEGRLEYEVYPRMIVYNVFNVAQTNFKEARPKLYAKMVENNTFTKETHLGEGVKIRSIDTMIEEQSWLCKIDIQYQNQAYYSLSRDVVVLPTREQFKDSESFYGNLLHEMAHSTGRKDTLNRFADLEKFDHGKEELIAELTAAFVLAQKGITKNLKSDSCTYLKSWLDSLRQDAKFIKNVLSDVKKASEVIERHLEAKDNKENAA